MMSTRVTAKNRNSVRNKLSLKIGNFGLADLMKHYSSNSHVFGGRTPTFGAYIKLWTMTINSREVRKIRELVKTQIRREQGLFRRPSIVCHVSCVMCHVKGRHVIVGGKRMIKNGDDQTEGTLFMARLANNDGCQSIQEAKSGATPSTPMKPSRNQSETYVHRDVLSCLGLQQLYLAELTTYKPPHTRFPYPSYSH